MLVDIVELPRRHAQFKRREASVNSEMIISYPISNLAREFGYWSPNDDDYLAVGGIHRLMIGRDALFRYKFIEPTKYGVAEYFVMTSSPIDVRFPLSNKRIHLYCPWVTITDPRTLKIRKFILWNGIFELMHYETEDSIHDVPVEAVILNEIRNQARLHNRPDVLVGLEKYPQDWKKVLISEERFDGSDAAEMLATLGSNIRAYNEVVVDQEAYYWPELYDIFRGLNLPESWTDTTPLRSCTFLSHVIHGSTTMGDIRHLFGMNYDTHAFQRMFNATALDPYTEISIYDENPDFFGLLKYIERLPYSEFRIEVDKNGLCNIQLYNQYDPYLQVKQSTGTAQFEPEIMAKISSAVRRCCPHLESGEIVRSWGEEVFFTLKDQTGGVHRYYFDLISASLGSRSLIRDYDGRIF